MIGVGVSDRERIEAQDAECRERRNDHASAEVRAAVEGKAGIDEQRRVAALHERCVSLADVEKDGARGRGDDPGRRRHEEERGRGEICHDAEPEARAAGGHHREERTPREDDRTRWAHEPRVGKRVRRGLDEPAKASGELRRRSEGEVSRSARRKQRHGECAERQRQHENADERDEDEVREQARRREHAEMQRSERRRGGSRGGRCPREIANAANEPSPRVAPLGAPSAHPEQRGARSKGHLRPRIEERGRIGDEHREGDRAQRPERTEGASPREGDRSGDEHRERALHRDFEAGDERIGRRCQDGGSERSASCIARRKQTCHTLDGAKCQAVREAGDEHEMEPRDREDVREAELAEGSPRAIRETRRAAAERTKQACGLSFPSEPRVGAEPERLDRGAHAPEPGALALLHHDEERIDDVADRPDTTAREDSRSVEASRVPPRRGRRERDPRPHPLSASKCREHAGGIGVESDRARQWCPAIDGFDTDELETDPPGSALARFDPRGDAPHPLRETARALRVVDPRSEQRRARAAEREADERTSRGAPPAREPRACRAGARRALGELRSNHPQLCGSEPGDLSGQQPRRERSRAYRAPQIASHLQWLPGTGARQG